MFKKLYDKFSSFADQHQTLITLIIIFALILITWGTEKIIDKYLLQYEAYAYSGTILAGLLLLWLTKNFILHVM